MPRAPCPMQIGTNLERPSNRFGLRVNQQLPQPLKKPVDARPVRRFETRGEICKSADLETVVWKFLLLGSAAWE